MPFDLREFRSDIIFTSHTWPTFWKKSSRSCGVTLADSCMHMTVRASLSWEGGSALGDGLRAGGPRVTGRGGLAGCSWGRDIWEWWWRSLEGEYDFLLLPLSLERERDRLPWSLEWECELRPWSLERERDLLPWSLERDLLLRTLVTNRWYFGSHSWWMWPLCTLDKLSILRC